MKLTNNELRIIDIALSFDIKDQEKFLEKIGKEDGLEDYLKSTKQLHEKINKYLIKK